MRRAVRTDQSSVTAGHRRVRGHRARDAAGGPGPDDPGHARCRRSPVTSAASPTSPGWSPRTCRGRGDHAAVGQARRPAWAQAPARDRARDVPGASALVRHRPGRHDADRRARVQGVGRRRADDAGDGRRRRSRRAARARPLPGLHRGHLRGRDRRRTARSAACWSSRSLALGLLREPAARARRARRPAPAPARRRPPTRAAPPRPRRRGAAGRPPPARCMLACVWGGDRYAWGSAPIVGLFAAAARAGAGAVRARAARRRSDRPARRCCAPAPSRSPAPALFLDDRVAVRGHGLRAAVPPGDDGRDARPRRDCCSCR